MNPFINALFKLSVGLLIIHAGRKLVAEGNRELWR